MIKILNLVCFYRDSPTKLDREVLSAIDDIDIDPQKFPSIQKWKSTMKSYSVSDMQRLVGWPDIFFAVRIVLSYQSTGFTLCCL